MTEYTDALRDLTARYAEGEAAIAEVARLRAALVEERATRNGLGYCSEFSAPDAQSRAEARADLIAEGLLPAEVPHP